MKNPLFFRQKIVLILWGVFLGFIFLEIILRFSAMWFVFSQDNPNHEMIRDKDAYTILCLGESTTALGGRNSYPNQLKNILNNKEKNLRFNVINKGLPSINTDNIVLNVADYINKFDPDFIVAMMGINDDFVSSSSLNKKGLGVSRIFHKTYKLCNMIARRTKNILIKYTFWEPDKNLDNGYEQIFKAVKNKDYREVERRIAQFYGTNSYPVICDVITSKILDQIQRCDNDSDEIELRIMMARINDLCENDAKAIKEFNNLLLLDPDNDEVKALLGASYMRRSKKHKAAEAFSNMKDKYSDCTSFLYLKYYYNSHKKSAAEIQLIQKMKKILKEKDPRSFCYDRIAGCLGVYYLESKNLQEAERYFNYAKAVRRLHAWSDTKKNYQMLKEESSKNGIILLCVQYPLRDVNELKSYFFNDSSNVVFVSNESNFKSAVVKAGYNYYFEDMFAGDFGHCTKEGNRLLAQNIAECILKLIRKK